MSLYSRAEKVMRPALCSETAMDFLQEADAAIAAKDVEIASLRSEVANLQATITEQVERRDSEIARLKDGERKYAVALTKDQGDIDWRKWMLVPATECEFIPKAKHDVETARLSDALKSAAAFLTWCLEETPIGKPPEIGPDVLAKCRAALAQVADVGR